MKLTEYKDVCVSKLHDEGCYFSSRDIRICGNTLYVRGYEHIKFRFVIENDDYFGICLYVNEEWYFEGEKTDDECIAFLTTKTDNIERMFFDAMLEVGYRIANTF